MPLWKKKTEIPLRHERESRPVPVVGDGAIASGPVGDGRLIPVVILDTQERPDVDELVRVHEHLVSGEVRVRWGSLGTSKDRVALILEFTQPLAATILLDFDIWTQGGLVDQIVAAHALYIQPGRVGDRVTPVEGKRLLLEIPETGFGRFWEALIQQSLVRRLRREGMPKRKARLAVEDFLEAWRRLGDIRIPRRPKAPPAEKESNEEREPPTATSQPQPPQTSPSRKP